MKLLLDTHVLLWALDDSPRLSAAARELLQDARNDLLVSAASFWELAIKMRLGKIALRFPLQEVEQHALAQGCRPLEITIRHTLAVADIECASTDPFDRLLLAQCEVETLRLVTADTGLRGAGSVLSV
ncbi:MAG: type II toxin-antitoxin system VapC family toxin [Burkholderiales bacterium]|nr:type II toxin-antitoxin system VapC family toxin [Burkholderiales bacterium]